MITKTAPVEVTADFPLRKEDIQYDPQREEVTVPRGKFDAFVRYVQALEEKLEAAEDERDVAEYRAQKAGKTADVLSLLIQNVEKATVAIRQWLEAPGHSLMELAERSRIPYATAHRIVNERLGTPKIEMGYLQSMVAAVGRVSPNIPLGVSSAVSSKEAPLFKRVLFGLPKGFEEEELISGWQTQGSKVETVHVGADISKKVRELVPDLILVDLSMPHLSKSGLEKLKEFAKDKNTTIVLTGKIAEANSALVEGSLETGTRMRQTGEIESAGG